MVCWKVRDFHETMSTSQQVTQFKVLIIVYNLFILFLSLKQILFICHTNDSQMCWAGQVMQVVLSFLKYSNLNRPQKKRDAVLGKGERKKKPKTHTQRKSTIWTEDIWKLYKQ